MNILKAKGKETTKKFKIKTFALHLIVFLTAFILFSSSCYALMKIFHFDDKFTFLFDKTDEELSQYGVSASDVNLTKEFDDATIVINQTLLDEKEIYIAIEITGKKEAIYLSSAYLSSGNTFDETIIKRNELLDGTENIELSCDENNLYGCHSYGFSLLKSEEKTNGYALTLSITGKIKENQPVTLRLISNQNKEYDISFTLDKNVMKVKEKKFDNIIYNENGIIINVSAIRLTPLHVIIDMEYNKNITTLTDEELKTIGMKVYNDSSEDNCYVTYKNGSSTILRLYYFGKTDSMLSPYGIHGTKIDQINDIENIESITINNTKFKMN